MNIINAAERVEQLSDSEVTHFMQIAQTDIELYLKVIENYPLDKMEKYGTPFLERLEERRGVFEDEFRKRRNAALV